MRITSPSVYSSRNSPMKSSSSWIMDEVTSSGGAGDGGGGDGGGDGGGVAVGDTVGVEVGDTVGVAVGEAVGVEVGDTVGVAVGEAVGVEVGDTVGVAVGDTVGVVVGDTVGVAVGDAVGDIVPVSINGASTLPTFPLMENVSVCVRGVRRSPSLNANDTLSPTALEYTVIWYNALPVYGPKGGIDVVSCVPRTAVPTYAKRVPEVCITSPIVTKAVSDIVFGYMAGLNEAAALD